MSAIAVGALGAGFGGGILLVARGLRPRPVSLTRQLAALDRPGVSIAAAKHDAGAGSLSGVQGVLARIGVAAMELLGVAARPKLTEQLRVLNKPLQRHAYEKSLAAAAGAMLPLFTVAAMTVAGVAVSPIVALALALGLGAVGFVYPDLPLGDAVAKRRQAFRHAFSSYLDLVTILIAGGAGIETALDGAAESSDGWAFVEIRRALRRARFTRRSPWEAFDDLGRELGISELNELAASISLAGDHGARIKQSLTAKADALRTAQSAEIERASESQTEKMIVPVVVMILGLVLFIAFGAVSAITDNGTSTFRTTPTQQHTGK